MKGFVFCSIFAAFYILIILLFQVSGQDVPNGNINEGPIPNSGSPYQGWNQPQNTSNGIVGYLQSVNWEPLGISNSAARQSINDVYGSISGNLECQKKSLCVFGNSLHNLPGRDLIFFVMSQYVPREWGVLYDVFRISVVYGQNCELFICQPQNQFQNQGQNQFQNQGQNQFQNQGQNQFQNQGQNQFQNQAQNQSQNQGPFQSTPIPTPQPKSTTAVPKEEEMDNEIIKNPVVPNRFI